MSFVQNVPCFSILAVMFAAIITSALKGKAARRLSLCMTGAVGVMSAFLLAFLMGTGESYVYVMGHFPAPWGNELRAGMLEAAMALLFCVIMLLALWGGMEEARRDLEADKANFYYIMADLMLASNLALVYTNDLFTAYVFVEINTIAACGLILGKFNDLTIAAGVRYMIMSLMGSGLLLLGISFFYDMTGHLLLSNIKESILLLWQTGEYRVPLIVTIGLVSVGLAIKSALWPFHAWLPNAYGNATASSSAMLSSIVSKGYIFLLVKVIYRVTGAEVFAGSEIINVLFVFGIIGMVLGSLDAVRQKNLRRMVAYSSVAQIGYIFMG
ncbi:complex I subunit 5 family protein, partial [Faecalicatena contorta]|uniref:complex I subunit 5 family protein n=1 Tax=Faecalicatena contorta TaxID=39482 RepID=UPI00241E5ED9